MEQRPDKPYEFAQTISKHLLDFNKHVPLLTYLCNDGLQDRHWSEINKRAAEAGLDFVINRETNFTLNQITAVGMMDIVKNLGEISDKATKEFSNQKLLDKMEDEWQEVDMMLKPWKETGTYIIKGECKEEIETL